MNPFRTGWQKARAWLSDGAYEKERSYMLIAAVVICGFALLLKVMPPGRVAPEPALKKFDTVLAAATLHEQLAGSYPSASRLQALLASDGVKAELGDCTKALHAPLQSTTLYVDQPGADGSLYVHTRSNSGGLLTLIIRGGTSSVANGGCPDASTGPPTRRGR